MQGKGSIRFSDLFVYALNQWCKVLSELEGQGYCVELSNGCVSVVLLDEIEATCQE